MSKLDNIREKAEERGDQVGPLLPANWIILNGKFSPEELKIILEAIEVNFEKVNGL